MSTSTEMAEAIRQLMQTKGISEELVYRTIEEALLAAYKNKFGDKADNAVVKIADDNSSVAIYSCKTIVAQEALEDKSFNPVTQIGINEALELNPESEIGDELLIEIDPAEFNRKSVQTAKQSTKKSLRKIQKDTLYSEYKEKVGEIIIGYCQRERNQTIYVDLGKVEGVLPRKMQSPRDSFSVNDRIKALIYEVSKDSAELKIVLSRTSPDFVKKILELEVPEIYDKTVEIYKIVREPGYRTKIAVYANKEDVDPVGACVGLKGVRIQSVIRELEGEKIDVIKYDDDPVRFIKNALSPAEVLHVCILDTKTKMALAVVSDEQFSLAIGKQGLNVRLANRLTDWIIDVKTQAQYEELNLSDSRKAADMLFGEYTGDEDAAADEDAVSAQKQSVALTEVVSEQGADYLREKGIEYAEDYFALSDEERASLDGLSSGDAARLDAFAAETLDGGDGFSDAEEEEFECPECGAKITIDMSVCPNCGIGLSFEYEDEDE